MFYFLNDNNYNQMAVPKKKTSKSITPEEARIICEKQINKMVNNSK